MIDSFVINNKFIIHDNCLNSLSLVSKQFLSITNRLKLSLCVKDETRPFLPLLLKRFTNLTSVDLRLKYVDLDLDDLLSQIANFPLKLTSLPLPYRHELAQFSLVRNCPSLNEIKMKRTSIGKESVGHSNSLVEFGVYPQLKSLYLDYNTSLSDEIIILFASIFPNLQLLDLTGCQQISEGICQVLQKCCKLKHLDLAYCKKVKLHGMNFEVPKLKQLFIMLLGESVCTVEGLQL
ncbi:RNI superfamily protein, putative [Medicago truncatula]|uniref:RNI superfamily protein, putative n=1 Tax=Medicago truncatula TaxID=3880 RepID=A0A072U7B2_MEDTR|nr:RNI superfamily protein, putative [Medicago truncatula]